MTFNRFAISLFACVFGSLLVQPNHAAEKPLVFETDIQPILVAKCGKCHTAKVRKGDLDLSTIGGLRRGGESGESVVAEALKDSLLWSMIDDGDMPPKGQPRLTAKQRGLIRDWIFQGARSQTPMKSARPKITQHDVLPIVLLRCTVCHGPRRQEGGVDLRTPTAMRKGGHSGPALVPGNPDESLMIQRVESEACPPRESLLKVFVKRPSIAEVKTLRDWIKAGAPEGDLRPDVASTESDPLVADTDRQHWAFQPPQSPPGRPTIDDLILRRLREKGLGLAPLADRDTLIRRVYLDLIGMPPTLDEWTRWHHSNDPDWYRMMVDHALSSPHYGERWGRYWLDVSGYADSEGGVSADPVRQVAWKYRDYVIQAFNSDKPYDRFLLEQIAGDELVDHQHATDITDEMVENLTATGFLRMGIDQTGSRTMNFVPERLGVIDDAIRVLGSGVLGLTLECARCHSHKYDPIPHRDYYRFKAIFQGALDEHDWLTFKNRSLDVATSSRRERVADINPPLQRDRKKLESRLKQASKALRTELLRQHYPQQSEADRNETLRALRIADNNRTQPQRILVEKLQQAEVIPDQDQPPSVLEARRTVHEIEQEILAVRQRMEPPLAIRALWDRGQPSPTYILRRGEHDQPGRLVGPGVPSVLTDGRTPFVVEPPFPGGTPKTGRRLAFARWLIQPDHPLTARVMVNRIWYHHFGTGLVKSMENFGAKGERPSHPELLDWLALEFVHREWSIKQMHRLIMNSRTFRQSNSISLEKRKRDLQNRLLSRMPIRRMNAEALRDSLLFVSGKLQDASGGLPDTVSVDRNGLVTANPTADGLWRRSVYLQYRRTEISTMMGSFDYPEMGPNCVARNVSTVSPQSLMLMNNRLVHRLAAAFAERVSGMWDPEAGGDFDERIDLVYKLALSRLPSDAERSVGQQALRTLETHWKGDRQAALETYCHTIFNSAAFLYVD
ncbi:MAG: DUF1553 domain-containing protein [Planctomycetaceae bacterium]